MKVNNIKKDIKQLNEIMCFSSGRQIIVNDREVADHPKAAERNSTPLHTGDIRKRINAEVNKVYEPNSAIIAEVDKILERLMGL